MTNPIVPSREDLLGHWYLVATGDGFLDARPRLDACELIATPGDDGRVRFLGEFTTPRRRYRMTTDTRAPHADGSFDWVGTRGLSMFTRKWQMAISEDRSVLSAYHQGSLVIQQGCAVFARAEVSPAEACATISRSTRELGLLPRQQMSMTFRARPAGMDATGRSELSHAATIPGRRPRFQMLRPLRP